MNSFKVQKGYSFTIRADYRRMKGLADAFEDFGIEPADPVCLITARKAWNSGNKYHFNYYCGIGECESQLFQFSMEVDVEDGEKLEVCALRFLENLLENVDWFEILREYRKKHRPDVFRKWLDNHRLNMKWAVEHFVREARSLGLEVRREDVVVHTYLWLQTSGNEWPMPAYDIDNNQNPAEKWKTAKENYEIYLRLLHQFFGMAPFMDTAQVMGFNNYIEAIQKCISEDADSFEWCWHLHR